MKRIFYIGLVLCLPLIALSLISPKKSRADLTYVRDTLSTSRLSVAARVLTISGNLVAINTSSAANFYSTSSANLRGGDAITINGVAHTVAAVELTSSNQFTTVAPAPAGSPGNSIYFKSMPVHQISFRTSTSVPNGFFRVLIPASLTVNNADGNPDPDGFDFNSLTNANSSSSATANFTFEPTLEGATASGGTNCTAGYHCFEYHYSGTGPSGSDITLWVGNGTSLIAPAPASGHNLGVADTYGIIVQQFPNGVNPSSATPVDSTRGRIALIESVRVTATVDPSISFQIAGMPSGMTACGVATTVNTQTAANAPLSVPFGTLSLNTFATAAHTLVVSTNALNGYIVTAIENDHMGKDGGTTPFIPDTVCNTGPDCTTSSSQNWDTAAGAPGFGYSLEAVSGATVEFAPGANFSARPFPNAVGLMPPSRIMYSTGVSNNHIANVCYRVSVDATQAAGDYENMVTYTATASF